MTPGGDVMEELPSQKRYKEADKKTCSQAVSREGGGAMSCQPELRNTVKGALEVIHAYNEDLTNKIVQNCSYACAGGSGSGDPSYYDRCKFLYYWLGTKIKETGKVKTDAIFQTVMNAIYKHQRSTHFWNSCKNHCTLVHPHITDDLFQNSKILHDYEYDYNKLKDDKEGKGECHKYCNNNQCEVPSEAAKSAYAKVKGICSHLTGAYCDEFDKQYKKGGTKYEEELPKLTCTTASGEEESTSTIQLTKNHLEVLPSYSQYYRSFKGNLEYCTYPCFPRKKIATALKEYFDDDKYANIIARTLCYVSTKIGMEKEPSDPFCKFFNFWLQHLLSKKLKEGNSPSTVINTINTELNGILPKHKCELRDLGTTTTTITTTNNVSFEHKKTLFEFLTDHDKMKEQFGGSFTTKPQCYKKYKQHLDAITNACTAVSAYCNGSGKDNDSYCTDYNSMYKQYCVGEGISKLQCDEVTEEREKEGGGEEDLLLLSASSLSKVSDLTEDDDHTVSCTEQLMGETTTTTTNPTPSTTVVSSILGVVGLPAIAALLYKYTSLPSLLRTQFGGRRNNNSSVSNIRKRTTTTAVERDFDDDTSIIRGSTTEYDSTIGDSSTIYSVPYIR